MGIDCGLVNPKIINSIEDLGVTDLLTLGAELGTILDT